MTKQQLDAIEKSQDDALGFLQRNEIGQDEQREQLDQIRKDLRLQSQLLRKAEDKAGASGSLQPWEVYPGEIKKDRVWDEDQDCMCLSDPIGSGNFGSVYRGTFRSKTVAIKEIKVAADSAAASCRTEVEMMHRLHHPNVVQFFGASMDAKQAMLVMELCKCTLGEAIHIASAGVGLDPDTKFRLTGEIIECGGPSSSFPHPTHQSSNVLSPPRRSPPLPFSTT